MLLGWFGVITALGSNAGATASSSGGASSGSSVVTPPLVSGGTKTGNQVPTWREAKVTLTIDPTYAALPYAHEALAAAVLAWTSTASELPQIEILESEELGSSLSTEANLADHRITYAPDGEPKAHGALAITLVTINNDASAIMDGDIVVNGEHRFTDATKYPVNSRSRGAAYYDLQSVVTHELGHWFGLGENYADTESTMYAYVDPYETKKRDLTVDDSTTVQLAYWRANNVNSNSSGCAIAQAQTSGKSSAFGYLAVALFSLRRSNRRRIPHVLAAARRLVIKGNSIQSR